MTVVSVESKDINDMALPPKLTAYTKAGSAVEFLDFVAPGGYSLKGNETKEISFAMRIEPKASSGLIARLQELVETANTAGVVPLRVTLMPKVQVGKDPRLTGQDFTSGTVHGTLSDPDPFLKLHVGPDLANVIKYYNKLQATTGLPPVAPPTAVVPPVLVPSPSPTTTIALPPVIPTPTPGTSDPVPSPSLVPDPISSP
ncbi:hypothetical protein BGZ92_006133 [Podila epicladia]|nr:hypothetical protein BGZ92_006133 [Podila epicladia]